jgi:uncharacterized repeat protein (TIGR02543 family)
MNYLSDIFSFRRVVFLRSFKRIIFLFFIYSLLFFSNTHSVFATTIGYTTNSSFTVPTGVNSVTFKAWGAGGTPGGGGGGFVQGTFSVSAGQYFVVNVGASGGSTPSGVFLNSMTQGNAYIVAGSGGNNYSDGAGGGTSGSLDNHTGGGYGGTQSAGGATGVVPNDGCSLMADPGSAGGVFSGGAGAPAFPSVYPAAGNGGAGYFGGGGGSVIDDPCSEIYSAGGGGGGSGYVNGGATGAVNTAGSTYYVANSGDADYVAGIGNYNQPGYVVITYTPDTTPPSAPGIMTTSWSGDHYVNTNFTAATSGSTDNIGVSYYNLCRSNDNAGGCSVWVATGIGASTVVSGSHLPSPGTYRYYYWYAYDAVGNQSSNSTAEYVRMDGAAPTTPGANTTSWVGDHYVNGAFTAATSGSTDAGIGVSYYNLCRSVDNSGGCNTWVATGIGTSATVSGTNLPSDGTYRYYSWYAYDGFGNQSGTTQNYVRMDATAPSISDISASNAPKGSTVRFYVNASDGGVGLNTGNALFYLGTMPYGGWNRVSGGAMSWNGSQYYYDVVLNDPYGTTYRSYTYVYDSLGNQGARDENPTEFTITNTAPPMSTPSSPGNGATVSGNGSAITFTTNAVADTDGQTPYYYFRVSTGSDGETGQVCNSGWITSTSYSCNPGAGTFYWHVYTYDGINQTNPNYVWSFYNNYQPYGVSVSPASGTFPAGARTFTSVYRDPNGGADINYVHLLINAGVDGNNGAFYGYYVRASNSCYIYGSDGNYAWNAAPYSTAYVTLNSCSSSVSGTDLTVTWNLTLNNWNKTMTEHTYVVDNSSWAWGWSGSHGTITSDTVAPTHDSVSVSSTNWLTNNSATYTITMASTESGSGFGGSYGLMALINYTGENAPNYRGYFDWHPTSYVYATDQMACTGGGYASKDSGYGAGYITLTGCSTSVVGNQRTVVFTVRPNTNFGDFMDNDVSFYTSDIAGNARGWTNFDTNFKSDGTAPTAAISFPANGGAYQSGTWGTIAGTASDAITGVNYTELLVCTNSSGSWQHWTGAAWTADCSWGQGISKAGGSWTDSSLAAGSLTEGYTYSLYTRVFDVAGNMAYVTNPWTFTYANNHTITFDSAGGSAVSPITQLYGTAIVAPANPTKTGYTFTGWSPAVPATMPIANQTSVAQWSINSYVVTFDTNGGNGGATAAQTLVYNAPTALTTNGFTKTGYTFTGWNTAANGSGTPYANGASYTIGAGAVTLYAQWSINSYIVTFDTNGGDGGATAAQTLVYNAPTALTSNGFTRTGYTFTGWNTAANGSGVAYANGASYTIGAAAVTLYAQWSINSYDLTINNSGPGTISGTYISAGSYTAAYGTSLTITASAVPGYSVAISSGCTASGAIGIGASCTFSLGAANTVVNVVYTISTNNLTITKTDPSGSGVISGTYSDAGIFAVNYGTSPTITASAVTGYSVAISNGCTASGGVGIGASCTVTSMTSATTVDVVYTVSTNTLTISNPSAQVIVGTNVANCSATSCTPSVDYGTIVTLTAPALEGYTFAWSGTACSGSTCSFTMDGVKSATLTYSLIAPTVISPTATAVTDFGATLGANVTAGLSITARGICWNTTGSPTVGVDACSSSGTSLGVYTQAVSGFPAVTLIYYRGYATNAGGTSYSADGTFTTLSGLAMSSAANIAITYGGIIPISTITIAEGAGPQVTALNDIRIKIATSTVHMLWDTADTTAVFGGTASGKVSNPVSYEGGGSVLVVPVGTNFSAYDTLTVSGLSFTNFTQANSAAIALALYTDGPGDMTLNTSDNKTVSISDLFTFADHTGGQVPNKFDANDKTNAELYAFKFFVPAIQSANVSGIVFRLSGVNGISAGDLTNVRLYRDVNASKTYDIGDVAVAGAGTVSITRQSGTITFSTPFSVTETGDYILVANVSGINNVDSITVALSTTSITETGATSLSSVAKTGTATNVQHIRYGSTLISNEAGSAVVTSSSVATGGSSGGGGSAVSSSGTTAGTITGSNGTVTIGSEIGFLPPTTNGSPFNAWTNGQNAYSSEGVYATTLAAGAQQSYGNFGFSVPSNNVVNGIAVKLEASGTTAAGTISVRLSWNGGSSVTSLKTTSAMGTVDAVYTLGGPSDKWGRSWTPAEFNNGNFTIELVGNPSSNTISVDAIQVSAYYAATGGSSGGGSEVFKGPNQYFANVYSAVGSAWVDVVSRVFNFLFSR